MNNERINKLIDTPFDSINPVNYDEVITELQARLRKAEEEIEVLRQYGNKDCTAMADEALKKY